MRVSTSVARRLAAPALILCSMLATAGAVRGAGPGPYAGAAPLDIYVVLADPQGFQDLVVGGFDIVGVRPTADPDVREVSLVSSSDGVVRLDALGLHPRLWRSPAGRSYVGQMNHDAAEQGGFTVFRPWDGDGGIAAELTQLAADHPDIVKRVVVGQSVEGRDIVALKVTKDANTTEDGTRPAVLYNAVQHAREWIAAEMNRRLVHHFVDYYGTDPTVTGLVDATELWFIVIANPDGYQLTHTPQFRMWRRNTRDNDASGTIESQADGVDINRNFAARWNYDNEGSSGSSRSDTYRGPSPASEPETQALQDLLLRHDFEFLVNYHSAAELILYPDGWQDQTRTADDPIFTALAGDVFDPAVEGFLPELSSGLYITNGETCDFAHSRADTLCFTPELSTPPGDAPSVFHFPDDEALIQAEFERNLPFALDIARSTADPTLPQSHLGNTTEPLYADGFPVSYGDPQPVQVNALRRLGEVTLAYQVNGGATVKAATAEWPGGERYGDTGDVHYHRLRGTVSGAQPGDRVTVWFEAGGETTEPFTYELAGDSGAPVLVVVAEDYTGTAPAYADAGGPRYLDVLRDALETNDYTFDVYDFDARDRHAPSHLGVLGHYRAVIWHTGDDVVIRNPGMVDGNTSRAMRDMMLAMRGYLNEGGKILYTGKHAGGQFVRGYDYDPVGDQPCPPAPDGVRGCESISNDFLQYYLGAWNYADVDGVDGATVVGGAAPFDGLRIAIGGDGARVDHGGAFGLTSNNHPPEDYPLFAGRDAASWENAGTKPVTGEHYLYTGAVNYEWQRLLRTVDLRAASSAKLELWVQRQTRQPFDAVFVEARLPDVAPPPTRTHAIYLPALRNGEGDPLPTDPPARVNPGWTTLLDANGHTTQTDALSCSSAQWFGLSAQFAHYMTPDPDYPGGCRPSGTTGEWNAATGNSDGWELWSIDLSPYAGHNVELSISHFSSRVAFTGAFVDDVTLTVDGATVATTSFEEDLGGWTLGGLPVNGEPHANDYQRATTAVLPPVTGAAVVVTEDSVMLGFGFEAIAAPADRNVVLRRALEHLGVAP